MLVLFFLDSDEMMNADVFLVLNVFGSLRFGHKLEYLSGARDISIRSCFVESYFFWFTQLKDTIWSNDLKS